MTSEIADGYADVLDDFTDFYYELAAAMRMRWRCETTQPITINAARL